MTFAQRPAALAASLVMACAGGMAVAQTSQSQQGPYQIGVSQTFTRYSNLKLLPNGDDPDLQSSTSVFAGASLHLGRQRLFGNVSVARNEFRNHEELDNNSHTVTAGLDWATVGNLAGNLSIINNRALAPFDTGSISTTNRNILHTQRETASFRLGGVSVLTLTGSLSHSALEYSDPAVSVLNVEQNSASIGLRYNRGGPLTLGTALRTTRGEYPNTTPVDKFRRNDIDFTATYTPSGASSLDARISVGRQRDDFSTAREFSGVTGTVGWNWAVTGKTRLNARFTRDTGNELSFFMLDTPSGPLAIDSDSATVANAFSLGVNYAATAKITVDASLYHLRRSLLDTTGLGSADATDTTNRAGLGVRWAPRRFVQLGCNASRARRSGTSGIRSYSANTVGCNVQFTLQP